MTTESARDYAQRQLSSTTGHHFSFTPPPRRHIVFAVISIALLMSSIDSTIVAVAIPTLRAELHTSIIWTGWTLTAYQLGQLLVLPVAGKMSDEWGRKRVFIASILVFTIASFLCGIAPNVYVLIICRVLQALGGGSFIPSCTGIVADLYEENRAKAIGLFTSIFPIGGILGPNIGGVIIDHVSWRFVFFVNVPFGIAVLLLTLTLYREPVGKRMARQHIDFAGVGIYGSAILIALLGLTWLGEGANGFSNPLIWVMFGVAIVLMGVFYRFESRTADPVIAPVLLKHRPFLAANLFNMLFGVGVFGVMSYIPTYFQDRYNLSAGGAGALLTPRAIAMIIASTFAALFIIRIGYRLPMIVGCCMQVVTLVLLSRGWHNAGLLGITLGDIGWLSFIMAITGCGLGISQPASNNAAIDLLPGKIAAVTGIRSMFRLTGGVLGTGTMTVVLAFYGKAHEADALERLFLALAVVNLIMIPLVFLIPDTARARRRGAAPSPPRLQLKEAVAVE